MMKNYSEMFPFIIIECHNIIFTMWLRYCHVKEFGTLKASHPFEALKLSSQGFMTNRENQLRHEWFNT